MVPNQSGKYNLISVWFNKISKRFSVCIGPISLGNLHTSDHPSKKMYNLFKLTVNTFFVTICIGKNFYPTDYPNPLYKKYHDRNFYMHKPSRFWTTYIYMDIKASHTRWTPKFANINKLQPIKVFRVINRAQRACIFF